MKSPYFLQYQMEWLLDNCPVKIWEKSRRIGATYAQSYEDVYDILSGKYPAVWFSSADETAAKEYIRYCSLWAKLFTMASPDAAILQLKKAAGMLQLHFANGKRITALSSNPKTFRSKGGKVVLDEFAHHDQAIELWKAAKPVTVWGYPIRILSTHNGQQSLFYKLIEEVKSGKLNWNLHTTTIYTAVEQGLVDAIYGEKVSEEEKQAWLAEQRKSCFDDLVWNEEFCCIPVDEKTAFLSYDLIRSCEDESLPVESDLTKGNELFAGIDIGRAHDLTVIYVLEKYEDIYKSRAIRVMKNEAFNNQNAAITGLLSHKNVKHCCIDATGIGMNLAEDMVKKFSESRVKAVSFTMKQKEELAYLLKRRLEDHSVILPADNELRDDLHSVMRLSGNALHARFDASRRETGSHADRFWALALALYAGENAPTVVFASSRPFESKSKILKGYLK